MSTKFLVAAVAAVGLCGLVSCARRADTDAGTASEPRVEVGALGGDYSTSKAFPVPLGDSLASLRMKPPGVPKFGESVYVTHLPQSVERPAPVYPDSARAHGVSGKVIVHTLVLADGTVGETWIIGSVPGLNEAAAHAVQRWKFTPALDRDKPVAVWIAVPVTFDPEAR